MDLTHSRPLHTPTYWCTHYFLLFSSYFFQEASLAWIQSMCLLIFHEYLKNVFLAFTFFVETGFPPQGRWFCCLLNTRTSFLCSHIAHYQAIILTNRQFCFMSKYDQLIPLPAWRESTFNALYFTAMQLKYRVYSSGEKFRKNNKNPIAHPPPHHQHQESPPQLQ